VVDVLKLALKAFTETVSQAFSADNGSLTTGQSPDVVLRLASKILSFTVI
jgi:hypothetical protein